MYRDVKITQSGDAITAHLLCEVDHHTARRLREKIDRALFESRPALLILDFSEVDFMDSSGIALILGRAQTCDSIGATVKIVGTSPHITRLLRVAGLERVKNLTAVCESNERMF